PTRIDDFESVLAGEFRKDFESVAERDEFLPQSLRKVERPFWNLQIPYIPKYNYREQRVIGEGSATADPATEKMIKAYTNIALHLAVLASEGSEIRSWYASEIATAFPYLRPAEPLRMLPASPAVWVSRAEQVGELREILLRCASNPLGGRVAVWGLPGSGKTSLVG